jgi:hypothetical protein
MRRLVRPGRGTDAGVLVSGTARRGLSAHWDHSLRFGQTTGDTDRPERECCRRQRASVEIWPSRRTRAPARVTQKGSTVRGGSALGRSQGAKPPLQHHDFPYRSPLVGTEFSQRVGADTLNELVVTAQIHEGRAHPLAVHQQ